MIKVNVKKLSNYPIEVKKVKKVLTDFFKKEGIVSEAEVSVTFVGGKKMLELSEEYLGEGPAQIHDVLSFVSEKDGDFVYPPDGLIHLGEIIICFPQVLKEANKERKMIDEKVSELLLHGAQHLLGQHHN